MNCGELPNLKHIPEGTYINLSKHTVLFHNIENMWIDGIFHLQTLPGEVQVIFHSKIKNLLNYVTK